jgi:hypothetical protein
MSKDFDPFDPMPRVDKCIREIQRGQKAIKLLHELWLCRGAYGNRMDEAREAKIWQKMNDFFGFDDSE